MATSRLVEERKQLFWEMLEGSAGENIEKSIKFDAFAKAVADKLGGKKVSLRTCQATLQGMQQNPRTPGTTLVVGKTSAHLRWGDPTVWDRRNAFRPGLKPLLGRVLWKVLLNPPLTHDLSKEAYRLVLTDGLKQKLRSLRTKSPIYSLIDAGTTTKAVVDELVNMKSMPFEPEFADLDSSAKPSKIRAAGGGPSGRPAIPYIFLHITTNSPPIEHTIVESKYRRVIRVRLVGGEVREEHRSICGPLAQQCLAHWDMRGDVAIVGATGFRDDFIGNPAFACNDLEEAQLKATFLSLAWVRVLVFDSSKLVSREVSKTFVPLSGDSVDLVVTDEGNEPRERDKVNEFCETAGKHGVATAVLRTRVRKKPSALKQN